MRQLTGSASKATLWILTPAQGKEKLLNADKTVTEKGDRDIRDIIFISGIRTAEQSCYQNAA